MASLRAEGFFCNLDILYGGLGIGKLQFLIKKKFKFFFFSCSFFQFLVIKGLDPDWIRIRIGPTSNAGSGSGKNKYGSETLILRHLYERISSYFFFFVSLLCVLLPSLQKVLLLYDLKLNLKRLLCWKSKVELNVETSIFLSKSFPFGLFSFLPPINKIFVKFSFL